MKGKKSKRLKTCGKLKTNERGKNKKMTDNLFRNDSPSVTTVVAKVI